MLMPFVLSILSSCAFATVVITLLLSRITFQAGDAVQSAVRIDSEGTTREERGAPHGSQRIESGSLMATRSCTVRPAVCRG